MAFKGAVWGLGPLPNLEQSETCTCLPMEETPPAGLNRPFKTVKRHLAGNIPDAYYHKIKITKTSRANPEKWSACLDLIKAIQMRDKYRFVKKNEVTFTEQKEFNATVRVRPHDFVPPPLKLSTETPEIEWDKVKGTFFVKSEGIASEHTYASFSHDLQWFYGEVVMGKAQNTFCHQRLKLLDLKYQLHMCLNETEEENCSCVDEQDFASVMKVDNHIHAAGAMTELEFLRFLKDKMANEASLVVTSKNETLAECMGANGVSDDTILTTEQLGMRAGAKMFHRFDHFNDAYNPLGKTDLRTLFMKTSNYINGRFFAELIRDTVFTRCSSAVSTIQALEPRLSIYGFGMAEWADLARFFVGHRMAKPENVKWQIQIPRLCNIFMGKKYLNFGELLRNIFDPVVQATLYPERYPELHILLSNIGGFDSVDDESVWDDLIEWKMKSPFDFSEPRNPSYSCWIYFMSENLKLVNQLRERRGMNVYRFAPHCGESGPKHHPACAFLLADAIMHGVKIVKHPVLTYLFYATQVGMALCPLSNDKLFLKLRDSPLGEFQRIGLNISVNTDDPLQFHSSLDPLLEEYLIMSKAFGLNVQDMCEIAFNSIKISSFDHDLKEQWLGPHFDEQNSTGQWYSHPNKTNITVIRTDYRSNNLLGELNYIYTKAKLADRSKCDLAERLHWDRFFEENTGVKYLGDFKFHFQGLEDADESKAQVFAGTEDDDKMP